MLYYLKKYPLSLFVIAVVIYLSFFKPSDHSLPTFPGLDKVVHLLMYLGMSGVLWLEYFRVHETRTVPCWHGWIGAFVCPIVFSGAVELLQSYCTTYRGGDWWDFAANATGVALATFIACGIMSYLQHKKKS